MFKTKVVTEEVTYECCDLCGEDVHRNEPKYSTTRYLAHFNCVDSLVEKNVLKEARQSAEKKASEEYES